MAQFSVEIEGTPAKPPVEWPNIEVLASFENSNVQANISTDEFTFANESAQIFLNRIANGQIFNAPQIDFKLTDGGTTSDIFSGFGSFVKRIHESKVNVQFRPKDNIFELSESAKGVTYQQLFDSGAITNADLVNVDYLEEEPDKSALYLLSFAIQLAQLIRTVSQWVKDLSEQLGTAAGISVSGITGPIGSALVITLYLLLNFIYIGLIVISFANTGLELAAYAVSPVRQQKAITQRTLLEKGMAYFGYQFQSSIPELDYAYLPSFDEQGNIIQQITAYSFNYNTNTQVKGIPRSQDFGYTVNEAMQLVVNLYYAKFAIVGNVVYLEPLINTTFWNQLSTYRMPGTIDQKETAIYNTDELNKLQLLTFSVDQVDSWTIEDFAGTNYQIITEDPAVTDNDANEIRGEDRIEFNVARPKRKEELNIVEQTALNVLQFLDRVVDILGGSSDSASRITSRLGNLVVSKGYTQVPKIVPLNSSNKIPANYRSIWSAEYLWENYHKEKSFVDNGESGKYILYRGVRVPFSLADFNALIQSNRFTTWDNKEARVDQISWNFANDFAEVDYRVQEAYPSNLTETKLAG